MSTSNTHQQSLADVIDTRTLLLIGKTDFETLLYFTKYSLLLKLKHQDLKGRGFNRYEFVKHYEAKIEVMNLILISIPNDIYNSVDACTTAKSMWKQVEHLMRGIVQNKVDRAKKLEKTHDPLVLVAHTGSSSRTTTPYYVAHPSSVVDYDDDYQGDIVQNNFDDPLTSAMILLARVITRNFSNPTNNRLCTSSNTRNQAIFQGDRVNIQSRNSSNDGRNTRRSYVQEEVIEVRKDEIGVILTDEHNDFLFADALRMEEIEKLSANICSMARIQPTNIDSDTRPSYDSAFLSEVQTPSTSYVNPLFAKDNLEQKYPMQPKIINNTIGDDQIDSNIIFDKPNDDVNNSSIEDDNNAQQSYELEQLARNAYKEAEKQQIIAKKV
ncbi:hypothetical protein Tco_0726294 [Tanacetum coccineum]|uniref:Uncharacterized protein n=1 Tax=Tanacetum coccineum TaxID=301880 RepID=A0ABQ4YHH7_9ASTR